MSNFDHHELCKESNLSYALLKEIMTDTDLEYRKNIISLHDIPMEDENGKILLLYNNDSVKMRRSNKQKYTYFNAFKDKSHFDFIINQLHMFNEEIDYIEIEDTNELTDWYSAKLMNIDNKVMKEIRVYDTTEFTKEKSILRLLLKYYNII